MLLEETVFFSTAHMFLSTLIFPPIIGFKPFGLLPPAFGAAFRHVETVRKETGLFFARENKCGSTLNASNDFIFHFITVQDNLMPFKALMDPRLSFEIQLGFVGALEYWSNGY